MNNSIKKPLRFISIAASMAALATLTACVAPQPIYETSRQPYRTQHYAAPQGPYAEYGRIANIEVIRSETRGAAPSGGGAVAGGLVGGALLGNNIESNANAPRAYESYRISVQTDNGGYRAFDVPTPGDLRTGDRVRIENGQISRY